MTLDQKTLIRELRLGGAGYAQIAKTLNINKNTLKSYCQRNGLGDGVGTRLEGINGIQSNPSKPRCAHCNAHIHTSKRGRPAVYCSDACRLAAWYLRRRGA